VYYCVRRVEIRDMFEVPESLPARDSGVLCELKVRQSCHSQCLIM
jgi:hypothetical protein